MIGIGYVKSLFGGSNSSIVNATAVILANATSVPASVPPVELTVWTQGHYVAFGLAMFVVVSVTIVLASAYFSRKLRIERSNDQRIVVHNSGAPVAMGPVDQTGFKKAGPRESHCCKCSASAATIFSTTAVILFSAFIALSLWETEETVKISMWDKLVGNPSAAVQKTVVAAFIYQNAGAIFQGICALISGLFGIWVHSRKAAHEAMMAELLMVREAERHGAPQNAVAIAAPAPSAPDAGAPVVAVGMAQAVPRAVPTKDQDDDDNNDVFEDAREPTAPVVWNQWPVFNFAPEPVVPFTFGSAAEGEFHQPARAVGRPEPVAKRLRSRRVRFEEA